MVDSTDWQRDLLKYDAQTNVHPLTLCFEWIVLRAALGSTTSADWLTTCVLALLVEAFIQQPASLLATGVVGDFIEEGADLLLELVQ